MLVACTQIHSIRHFSDLYKDVIMLWIREKSCVGNLWPTVVYIRINYVYVVFAMLRLVCCVSHYSPVTSLINMYRVENLKYVHRDEIFTFHCFSGLWRRYGDLVGSWSLLTCRESFLHTMCFLFARNQIFEYRELNHSYEVDICSTNQQKICLITQIH